MTAAYDFIGDKGPLNIGDTVILGASTKMMTGKDGSVPNNMLKME